MGASSLPTVVGYRDTRTDIERVDGGCGEREWANGSGSVGRSAARGRRAFRESDPSLPAQAAESESP